MKSKKNTIIIGSGILGASHALTLSPTRNVYVFDFVNGPGQNMGTGASSACIRRHYSHPELAILATYGFNFIEGLSKSFPNINLFSKTGCLSVAEKDNKYQSIYRRTFNEINILFKEYSSSEMRSNFIELNVNNYEVGIYDENAGYADPQSLTNLLINLARSKGAQVKYNIKIAKILFNGSKVSGVQTDGDDIIPSDEVIIAGSYLTESLLSNSGINLELPSTSKRSIFTIYAPLETGKYRGPIFADFSNEIYCKPESEGILVGSLASEDEDHKLRSDEHNFTVKEDRLVSLLDRIQMRFKSPIITKDRVKIVKGIYDVNDFDWIPIQDQCGPEGLYLSFATSGHGFKLAFAMSELLLSQMDQSKNPKGLGNIDPAIFNLNHKRINAVGVLA